MSESLRREVLAKKLKFFFNFREVLVYFEENLQSLLMSQRPQLLSIPQNFKKPEVSRIERFASFQIDLEVIFFERNFL